MYTNQNRLVTGVLEVVILNFIEQVSRSNAVDIYYFHKYEGEQQINFYWER